MYELTARDFPIYAGVEPEEYTGRADRNNLYGRKEKAMKAERIIEVGPEEELPPRMRKAEKRERFTRRYGLALAAAMGLAFWSMLLCIVTGAVVHSRTEKTVRADTEAEMRASFQAYLDRQAEEAAAARFLSGEASFEAAVQELGDSFDELIAAYAQDFGLREDALHGLGWTFIARYVTASSEFGKTPEEIIGKKGAWEGSVAGHAVRDQDTAIAMEIAREYLSGHYPDGWTPGMTFGSREAGGGWVARNEFITGPNTMYWRYGK